MLGDMRFEIYDTRRDLKQVPQNPESQPEPEPDVSPDLISRHHQSIINLPDEKTSAVPASLTPLWSQDLIARLLESLNAQTSGHIENTKDDASTYRKAKAESPSPLTRETLISGRL